MKTGLTKKEEKTVMEMAKRVAGVSEGGQVGRWTRDDRVMLVYSVLCSLYRLSRKKK